MADTLASSWRLKCITDAYLFGYYAEIIRQESIGAPFDQDAAVRNGEAVRRKVERIVGPEPGA